ncbi:MAG: immunoglobulin-like domain-containing protein, partial [Candidatus Ornithomonoglobus sp.]
KILSLITAFSLAAGYSLPIPTGAADSSGLIPAFPGAEGAGMYATGGRGGTVYHVTNLNDSGAGSFRDAVSASNRIVVFDVGGTIELKSDVVCKGNVTIAGQTAPGGHGITLKNGKFGMGGDNIIVRFISSRPGEKGEGSGDYDAWGGSAGSNSIIDHCSIGWANDEQFGLYSQNMNQTVQYTIIGPSNCVSYHSKGAHGFGAMFGKGQNSWHHNLLCHSLSRNFRGKVVGTNTMDFVNNVIYDWGYQTAYGTHGRINYVNNYLKAGPSTKSGYKFINISSGTAPENYRFFLSGNRLVNPDGTDYNAEINNNQWLAFNFGSAGYTEEDYRVDAVMPVAAANGDDVSVAYNAESAEDAFDHVTSYAGAAINAASRTKIDDQVLEEAKTGTGSLTGGRVFSTVDDDAVLSAITTYGIQYCDYSAYYPTSTAKEITDSDNDGMDDNWELERGLDTTKDDSADDYLGQGYTNIEYYINDLTVDAFPAGVVEASKTTTDLGQDFADAKADAAAITLSPTIISKPEDLTLPTTGSSGSSITWASSSSAVVIKNNIITAVKRPETEDLTVTLVATVTKGEYTFKKSVNITVKATSIVWIPQSSENGAAAGTELMDGLTCMSTLKISSISGGVTINGDTYSCYATGVDSDGNVPNGTWADGAATGTAFKYTAAEDGFLSAYITSLGSNKTAYIVEEGVANKEDNVGTALGTDGAEQVMVAPVEAGHTYYIFVAGSGGRFAKIAFGTVAPDILWKASADVEAGGALARGLTAAEAMTYTAKSNMEIDGIAFTGCILGTNNPGGTVKGETGAALHYEAYAPGLLTVYYKIGSSKTFKLTDAGGNILAQYTNDEVLNESGVNIGVSEYTSTTAQVSAGTTYYAYVDGSKAEFYGAAFEQTAASETEATPIPSATAAPTPTPTAAPVFWKASEDVTTADTLMTGLTAGETMSYTVGAKEIDGEEFTGYVACGTNPSYGVGTFSGAGLIFTAAANGTFTAYMEVNANKTFTIMDSENNIIAQYTPTEKGQYALSADVNAGKTYYAFVNGSTARIYGAKFEEAARLLFKSAEASQTQFRDTEKGIFADLYKLAIDYSTYTAPILQWVITNTEDKTAVERIETTLSGSGIVNFGFIVYGTEEELNSIKSVSLEAAE